MTRRQQAALVCGALMAAVVVAAVGRSSPTLTRRVYLPLARRVVGRELVVFAPCNMLVPIARLAEQFQRDHPLVRVKREINHALVLIEKLRAGTYADVCVLPGPVEEGLLGPGMALPGSRTIFGRSYIALVVRKGLVGRVRRLQDLSVPEVKTIAVPAAESSSIGAFGTDLLKRSGVWPLVESKLVRTRLPMEAVAMVAKHQADVAISSRSCPLKTMPPPDACDMHRSRILAIRDQSFAAVAPGVKGKHRILWLGGVVLAGSKEKELSAEFLTALTTEAYQRILRQWHLDIATAEEWRVDPHPSHGGR